MSFFSPSLLKLPFVVQLEGTRGSAVNSSISRGTKSTDKEKKIGHRRVGEDGEITYKKIQTSTIMGSIQLGIQHTVSDLHILIFVFISSFLSSSPVRFCHEWINKHSHNDVPTTWCLFNMLLVFFSRPTGRKLSLETQTWLADDGLLGNGDNFISTRRIKHNASSPL